MTDTPNQLPTNCRPQGQLQAQASRMSAPQVVSASSGLVRLGSRATRWMVRVRGLVLHARLLEALPPPQRVHLLWCFAW